MAIYSSLRRLGFDVHLRPILDKPENDPGPEVMDLEDPDRLDPDAVEVRIEKLKNLTAVGRKIAPSALGGEEVEGGEVWDLLRQAYEHDLLDVTWLSKPGMLRRSGLKEPAVQYTAVS